MNPYDTYYNCKSAKERDLDFQPRIRGGMLECVCTDYATRQRRTRVSIDPDDISSVKEHYDLGALYDGLAEAYPDYDLSTYAGRCELAQDLYNEAVQDGGVGRYREAVIMAFILWDIDGSTPFLVFGTEPAVI